jgi:hypothetical protein
MPEWWEEGGSDPAGDYNPTQTGAAENQFDANTVYSPPGQEAPIDQWNFTPDPNAPGGYQAHGPGTAADPNLPQFSNQNGQYPNDQSMADSIANQQVSPQATVTGDGNAGFMAAYSALGSGLGQQGQKSQVYTPEQFSQLPPETQALFNNTYPGQGAQVWAQQATQNAANAWANVPPQPSTWANYTNYAYSPQNGYYDPATGRHTGWGSIGAGTQWTAPGWGVPGFGMAPQQMTPQNWAILSDPKLQAALAPGYIPGSGTYNQFNLSKGNLFGNIAGQPSNLNYGVGGPGDPTTGLEPQTPDEWIQGGKLFTWNGNMGTKETGTEGLDYIATLFGRSDTPSGIGTPAWNAPKQFWDGLGQAIAAGKVQPTNRGWAALLAKGYTPQNLGGAAIEQAKSVGVQANGQGASGGSGGAGTGPMGPGTQAFNYQAAYLDYLSARMKNLEIPGMENQNQQFHDQLAFEQAKQAFLEKFQNMTFEEQQRQFNEQNALAQGQLLGSFNGQDTLGKQQLNQQTSLGYLNLLAQLRGPGDIFQYLKVLNGTPGGMKDIVNAAAGSYNMPSFGGGVTVGGGTQGADLNSLLTQLNNPNYGSEAKNINLPLPNQISAQALLKMSPSQQQTLLAAYEAAGYNPQDVMAIFKNSLPQYGGAGGSAAQGTAGRVGLFG